MTDKGHADLSSLTQTQSAGVTARFPNRIADSSPLVPIGGYDNGCRSICAFRLLSGRYIVSHHRHYQELQSTSLNEKPILEFQTLCYTITSPIGPSHLAVDLL